MSVLWVFSQVPQIICTIPSLKIPVWLNGLSYIISYGVDVHKSVVRGYNKSIQAILTSAGVLILVTAIVGNFASSTAAKICKGWYILFHNFNSIASSSINGSL